MFFHISVSDVFRFRGLGVVEGVDRVLVYSFLKRRFPYERVP